MTDVQPAPRELAALAVAMRGWDGRETADAIMAARNAGWDFERIAREVFRLLLIGDGEPATLRHAARNLIRPVASSAADGPAEAAKARELYPNLRNRPPGSAA